MENRYVAKCSLNLGKFHDYELSPRFSNTRDCLEFIQKNKNVILIEFLLSEVYKLVVNTYYDSDGNEKFKFSISFGSMVRVYDLEQNRFCDSFDF